MFNKKIKQGLFKILVENGTDICKEPMKLKALLEDYCGDCKKEVFMVSSALHERIAEEILSSTNPYSILRTELMTRISDNLGFAQRDAITIIDLWALALGRLTEREYNQYQSLEEDNQSLFEGKELSVQLGDYIQFGTYLDAPIIWRVINIDEDGDPMLFSEYILSFKAFAAVDGNKSSVSNCITGKYGSNGWENSNLRDWLNSREEKVKYSSNPPVKEALYSGYNPYADEPGFLYAFTQTELNALKPVRHKVLLKQEDIEQREGGSELHKVEFGPPSKALTNYDNAYYKILEDKVYLLSLKELKEYVEDNKCFEWVKSATPQALLQDESRNIIGEKEHRWYWLRTPNAAFPSVVLHILNFGDVYSCLANNYGVGVCPALNLHSKSIAIQSGTGMKDKPYILKP